MDSPRREPRAGPRVKPDSRPFERATQYRSHILWDEAESLGYPFVMYYNGKQQGPWIERIGMVVSRDLVHWSRYGEDPVIDNGKGREQATGLGVAPFTGAGEP
jgi:hypothetical protein